LNSTGKITRSQTRNCVDPAPEPRHVELQVEMPNHLAECGLEYRDLVLPGLALLDFEIVRVCRRQDAEDALLVRRDELIDRSGIVRGSTL